ncbi:PilZ domain-containing protein [Allopontixanthobacter sediminis]|uniref:PilZ domain-containing protein n=1 Tax=Allopontixanthobacter sediminis TaxID=1689985 RepID=A0A845B587_9SPHN|nr:PilZ domain-containing protein [Allopontixanthobacter sediminis]MXP44597.1 hypothetical protein [Allopontixanthobacter sediminis]
MRFRATLNNPVDSEEGFPVDAAEGFFQPRRQRRSLTLSAVTSSHSKGETQVEIRDISEGGLLLKAELTTLSTEDVIEVVLPGSGPVQARVVWQSGRFSGCQFDETVSVGAVSAALLKSSPAQAAREIATAEGTDDGLEDSKVDVKAPLNWSIAFYLSLSLWAVLIATVYSFAM